MRNEKLTVNPAEKRGKIRPMNGVGGGPVTANMAYDASEWFREAKIPFCRTHDIEYPYGSGEYVDIHNLFPDFEKDENDPANYNFILTDAYMKNIDAVGAKPLYRLGTTIEHAPIKRYIHPPKDFEKWGRICSRIIAHYNEGWGDGFRLGIEYWEIWNEPDISPCWTGTHEQIVDLYEAASKIIKREHPDVKIGGLAFANAKTPLIDLFLTRVVEKKLPLDFLSWHGYVHLPSQTSECAGIIRDKLKQYGLEGVESVYDEWNYVMGWGSQIEKSIEFHYTPGEAAFMGAMTTSHDEGIDVSCYYDVQMLMERVWNGVFGVGPRSGHGTEGQTVKPLPGYYALKYWGELSGMTEIAKACTSDDVYATAAISDDGKTVKVLISHFADKAGFGNVPPEKKTLTFDIDGKYKMKSAVITDRFAENYTAKWQDGDLLLNGYAIALVTFEKSE
ncbi:MAG: hypothetical protein MJ082_02690 [Clostridia bacterium]|nr:hypothetical protein [Clostridia bacterium]